MRIACCSRTCRATAPCAGSRRGRLGLSRALRLRQRPDARPAGPADLLLAPRALPVPHRARRPRHDAGRSPRRPAAEFAQRRGGQVRRHDLVHRSAVRHIDRLRGRPAAIGAAAGALSLRSGERRHPCHRGRFRRSERARLLARRKPALRRRDRRPEPATIRSNTFACSMSVRTGGCPAAASFAKIEPGYCDGMSVDEDGNVWSSAADGVHCFRPTAICSARCWCRTGSPMSHSAGNAKPAVHRRLAHALRDLSQSPRRCPSHEGRFGLQRSGWNATTRMLQRNSFARHSASSRSGGSPRSLMLGGQCIELVGTSARPSDRRQPTARHSSISRSWFPIWTQRWRPSIVVRVGARSREPDRSGCRRPPAALSRSSFATRTDIPWSYCNFRQALFLPRGDGAADRSSAIIVSHRRRRYGAFRGLLSRAWVCGDRPTAQPRYRARKAG